MGLTNAINSMTAKKIHLIETFPEGLKTVRSYLSEINANHDVFCSVDDAMCSRAQPDLVILLARKRAEYCNEDIAACRGNPSLSRVPLMLMVPLHAGLNIHAIERGTCQCVVQMPADKLQFLARVANFLKIPPRRIFQVVITIMEEDSNIRYAGISVDFSETGMAFECSAEFAVGRKITIRFIDPKNREKFLLNAEIVRMSETLRDKVFFYGVRFRGVTHTETVSLKNFISGGLDGYRQAGRDFSIDGSFS